MTERTLTRRPATAVAIAALLLGACSTSILPETAALRPAPAAWTHPAELAPEVEDRWWLAFDDALLNDLVAAAGEADTVGIAETRLTEALARLGSARAALRPEVGGSAEATSQRIDDLEQDQLTGLISLAFSPDLNGARSARREAALASADAEAARLAAARQAARATAVRLYLTWAEGLARAEAAERSVAALDESLRLAERRERAGLTSGLDPVAVRAQLASARARPAAAKEAAETARLGLEALLGRPSGALASDRPQLPALQPQPLIAPVAVLARRPDLIAAERDLAAAGFEAQATRRDFWPTVSLSAALGGQSIDPETPFTASGGLIQASAGLAAPLFSFGRLEAARDGADARRARAALSFRQAAIDALSEVEQALVAQRSAAAREAALAEAVAAGRDRVALATSRYRAGLSPLLDALTAEDALASAEAELATARADGARARAALAVGMGLGAL